MAASTEENYLRVCRLCVWSNYNGFGFDLENAAIPPHIIRTVESNSPAAAGGLRIRDLILAVNNQDVSAANYKTITKAIKNAQDSNEYIDLLVIEKRFYELLKQKGISFNPRLARIIEAPTTMPRDYMNFPKYTPRTCEIHLSRTDKSFGFEVVNGNKDIGALIQEIIPNTPASKVSLRKSDRILEIDDKFVDYKTSRSILDKLAKAKKKRSVKLYVVDTNTYKHFQEYGIPLTSKEFRKSKFARQQQPSTSTYINAEAISTEPRSVDVDNQQSNTSEIVITPESYQDDIRLCTINRANPEDTYGIELSFYKKYQYHSIQTIAGRDNGPSNAALAGVKNDDHLIEINGKNIENIGNEQVTQRIRAIKYPQPLQILVTDSATYNYYKGQNEVIHSRLPSVKKLPLPHQGLFPVEESLPGITGLVNSNSTQPKMPVEISQSNRRNYKLHLIPGFRGYGFCVNSNFEGTISHKIIQIAPYSPAAQQGLLVGDYILTVNDRNVEKMDASDFNQFLRISAQNAETHGNPLLLQVINEDSYQPSVVTQPITSRDDSTECVSTKQQQRLNLDPNDNCRRLKTEKSRVLIDTKTVQKENDIVCYSDDCDSDYSDDQELNSHNKPKLAAIRRSSLSKSKTSNNAINLVPSDSTAFEASFYRKRQEVIDNMSYRQAINSWNTKQLHDVVKLIIGLSKGQSLIDRAWIIFYWVSQNIEYDVEAYFSGNISHQTPEEIFASGKGVCDAFGTIFETLCNAVQIECKKISGYAKGYSYKMGQKSFARTNHAWNVICLEGHWYLVDPTWGEGFLDTNNCNRKELNPFYFLVRPEQMIYRHLPEDPKWQLLMSPISMDDFVRLPVVYPTFFEHNLTVIYPGYSNIAPFNSNLELTEVLVQAPSDTVLIGNIKETESGKIKNGCLIQYDADRQQWQCLFAPQQGGFHILTLFARREKQAIKNKTDDNKYSCAIKFGLNVPTDVIKAKTFPLTYDLFTERKCQIFEPLDGVLKSGSRVTIHCRIPGAYCVRLLLDGNWLSEDLIQDDIFKRLITVPKQKVKVYVQFSDKQNSSSYDGLFYYSVK